MLLICPLLHSAAFAADQAAVEQATKAAESWLKLLDQGNYRACYDQASEIVKTHIASDGFAQELSATLKPFGPVISRKLNLAQYATRLPGAPDGQYVVIQYETSFANKKSAIETVAMMLDKDGQWRVSGYHIK
ncbi:MAG: DUF4019 domain-containing protein [Candidatus Binataceae bacterium]